MKNRNFVNLNINPCKMCMPMGAVTAFKGIENSMTILHGSQGCSTYIRRHMAGHYNEPIDIASSSLNEEGTIYGGEHNLIKGLKNLIKLYNPSIIGVATTCLAETIGEDIKRIVSEFTENENNQNVKIIPVSTAGYSGTQFEGYFAAILSIIKTIAKNTAKNNKINIITGYLSPGDIRNIKEILKLFDIEYILIPDISTTLDAPYSKEYSRIAMGGTKYEDIENMAGSIATIEISSSIPDDISPGYYLKDKFNIPYYRSPYPIGLKNTDEFIRILSEITNKPIPNKLQIERGRLIDAMIDSHKFNGEGRAVVYGEPDLTLAVSSLCAENGIKPVLMSTGTENKKMIKAASSIDFEEAPLIIDDTDFETILDYSKKLEANILIGNSDGKFITEKVGIPLVRIGFPIHDRIGGQRLVSTGYNGSLRLLDEITNTLIEQKYNEYREKTFKKYYIHSEKSNNYNNIVKTSEHPCFNGGCSSANARMHIPVAPACNISCNYCNRKYDCVNESRPGVTSEILSPLEAVEKFAHVKSEMPNLKVVGIAGPGDALANFENTKKSIELIKEVDPDIIICLSTNGLMLPYYADDLINMGISHITITINAIDAKIGSKIYNKINFMEKEMYGEDACEILIRNQLDGLSYLASKGVICKVNIVMIKGINDHHIQSIVHKVKELGAHITNIMPLIPAKGTAFENFELISNKELNEKRKSCEEILKQMYHCQQCRADAIGTLGCDLSQKFTKKTISEKVKPVNEIGYKARFAVASKSGITIDRHFGQVEEFYIYNFEDNEVKFIETRTVEKYCTGQDECDNNEGRIDKIIKTIQDCNAVLAIRVGYSPLKILNEKGIKVIESCGKIEDEIINVVASVRR